MRDSQGDWHPPTEFSEASGLAQYMAWLSRERGLAFGAYADLWRWSVEDLDAFWSSIWDRHAVSGRPAPPTMLADDRMPGAIWCPGTELNYARHLVRAAEGRPGATALIAVDERDPPRAVTWEELTDEVGALAHTFRRLGVGKGDLVAAYLPNVPEAIVGLIACASIGAIWSICAPDFGTGGVVARFAQLSPKILLAAGGYQFGGRTIDRAEDVRRIVDGLPTLEHVIWVDRLAPGSSRPPFPSVIDWGEAVAQSAAVICQQLPFDHPLWVLFSSGTTGAPKGIVHSHGGILLELLKAAELSTDVRPGDRYLLLASTSWMVWNVLVSSLLVGAIPVVLDGSPLYPDARRPWTLSSELEIATLGVGAGLIHACAKQGLRPGDDRDLTSLRSVLSTGSPLSIAGYRWVWDAVGEHVWLNSISGGTDICSSFVGGCTLLPVRPGRIQAPALGVAAESWSDDGRRLVNETGELVVRRPMPSMPIGLWGDAGSRYESTYFSQFPGVWRHGDFIEFDEDLSSVIHGRSDSTLNRQGVRLGPADIYAAVDQITGVRDALVVGAELGEDYYMPLFVELDDDVVFEEVRDRIIATIRDGLSPRHVPDDVIAVPGIPYTKTGKKLEVPVKRMLQGLALHEVADPAAVNRPDLLEWFHAFAMERNRAE